MNYFDRMIINALIVGCAAGVGVMIIIIAASKIL